MEVNNLSDEMVGYMLDRMLLPAMRTLAQRLGLPKAGRKAEVRERLQQVLLAVEYTGDTSKTWHQNQARAVLASTFQGKVEDPGAGSWVAMSLGAPAAAVGRAASPTRVLRCVCGHAAERGDTVECVVCGAFQHAACLQGAPQPHRCERCRVLLADPFWVPSDPALLPPERLRPRPGAQPFVSGNEYLTMLFCERTFVFDPFSLKSGSRVTLAALRVVDDVACRVRWPRFLGLRINGTPVRPVWRSQGTSAGGAARDPVADLTPHLVSGRNTFSLSAADVGAWLLLLQVVAPRAEEDVRKLAPAREGLRSAARRAARLVKGVPIERADVRTPKPPRVRAPAVRADPAAAPGADPAAAASTDPVADPAAVPEGTPGPGSGGDGGDPRDPYPPSPGHSSSEEDGGGASSDEADVEVEAQVVSLRDTLSGARIVEPARFRGASGLQPLDLGPFLASVQRTRKWVDPSTLRPSTVLDLQPDAFFEAVLRALRDQPTVEEVEVGTDGRWRPAGWPNARWRRVTEPDEARLTLSQEAREVGIAHEGGGAGARGFPAGGGAAGELTVDSGGDSSGDELSPEEELRQAAQAFRSMSSAAASAAERVKRKAVEVVDLVSSDDEAAPPPQAPRLHVPLPQALQSQAPQPQAPQPSRPVPTRPTASRPAPPAVTDPRWASDGATPRSGGPLFDPGRADDGGWTQVRGPRLGEGEGDQGRAAVAAQAGLPASPAPAPPEPGVPGFAGTPQPLRIRLPIRMASQRSPGPPVPENLPRDPGAPDGGPPLPSRAAPSPGPSAPASLDGRPPESSSLSLTRARDPSADGVRGTPPGRGDPSIAAQGPGSSPGSLPEPRAATLAEPGVAGSGASPPASTAPAAAESPPPPATTGAPLAAGAVPETPGAPSAPSGAPGRSPPPPPRSEATGAALPASGDVPGVATGERGWALAHAGRLSAPRGAWEEGGPGAVAPPTVAPALGPGAAPPVPYPPGAWQGPRFEPGSFSSAHAAYVQMHALAAMQLPQQRVAALDAWTGAHAASDASAFARAQAPGGVGGGQPAVFVPVPGGQQGDPFLAIRHGQQAGPFLAAPEVQQAHPFMTVLHGQQISSPPPPPRDPRTFDPYSQPLPTCQSSLPPG